MIFEIIWSSLTLGSRSCLHYVGGIAWDSPVVVVGGHRIARVPERKSMRQRGNERNIRNSRISHHLLPPPKQVTFSKCHASAEISVNTRSIFAHSIPRRAETSQSGHPGERCVRSRAFGASVKGDRRRVRNTLEEPREKN